MVVSCCTELSSYTKLMGNANNFQSFTFCVTGSKVFLVYTTYSYLTLFGQYSLNILSVKIGPRSRCVTQKYDSKSSVSAALGCSS